MEWVITAVRCVYWVQNKLMIVFQDISCGAIYAIARCLTMSCPSYKTCVMLMNICRWMGIRQLLCSHLSVSNRDVPSPLSCLPYTWATLIAQKGWKAHSLAIQTFWWPTCYLLMTFPSCPTTLTTCRPRWTNYKRMHKESLTVISNDSLHKIVRWCVSIFTLTIFPLSSMMARSSPTQTPYNVWAWFVTDISMWMLQLMQRYAYS